MLCEYGCNQEAKYQFKNKKWCCSESSSQCPFMKNKNNKHLKGTKQKPRSENTKIKISNSLKGRKHKEEDNLKKSKRMKEYWSKKRINYSIEDYPFCKCGCGERVSKINNEFILGHHARVIDCVWNRGLTKETSPSVKKHSNSLKGRSKDTHIGIKNQSEKMKNIVPWMKGKKHTKESKEKMSKSIIELNLVPWNKGKTKKDSKRLKNVSEQLKGRKRGPNKFSYSNETRKKQRLAAIKRIESRYGQVSPNYNPEACKLIDKYGKENNYNFQHAENGGEFYIRELGYWVDGYDKQKNVVIEIDEDHHFNENNDLKERDIIRQQEIMDLLNCEFIRIRI